MKGIPISRKFPAHAADARADQRLVDDDPQGEVDLDRREGRQPRVLPRLPAGGGRHPAKSVRRDFAVDRRTAAAAGHVDRVRRSFVTRLGQTYGRGAPDDGKLADLRRLSGRLLVSTTWADRLKSSDLSVTQNWGIFFRIVAGHLGNVG